MLRRARTILGSEAEAQETLQELFLSLLDRPEQFAGRSSITTFLYRMTTNLCLNKLRDSRNRRSLLERNSVSGVAEDTSFAKLEVAELLARLPEPLGQVAVYYYMDEMSQAEISEVLGCSRRMVGKHLSKLHKLTKAEAA